MKRRSNLKKNIIILIAIFLVFILLFVLYNFFTNTKKYKVFVFSNGRYLLYQDYDNKWSSISKEEFIDKHLNFTYDLYTLNKKQGSFIFKNVDDELEIVNPKNDITNQFTSNWFAFGGDLEISYIKFLNSSSNENDRTIIFDQLLKKGFSKKTIVTYYNKYSLDIDNDGKTEEIFTVNNMANDELCKKSEMQCSDNSSDRVYSFMFLVDGNNIYDIYNKIVDKENESKLCIPTPEAALSFRDDSVKIISYCQYSNDSYDMNLYDYKNGKISLININN